MANQIFDPIALGYADQNNLGLLLKGSESIDLPDQKFAQLKDGKFDIGDKGNLSIGQVTSSPLIKSEVLIN